MKKHLLSAAIIAAIVTATGCTSFNVSQPSAALDTKLTSELKADIAVGETISGNSSINVLFGFIKFGGDSQFADGVSYSGINGGGLAGGLLDGFSPVEGVKSAAAFKAVTSSGADIIVAPRYEVTVNDYFVYKTVDVKVTGKKGTIRSIR